ncbi:reverse transcriptase protein [Rutstroemia sp. NJR-2017a BBW]|nr:reverse transcriptase protein [Rutstroemia sp. NJR-2017a BBW]
MATPWPQVTAWPTDLREHATYLSDYLRKALVCIDSAENEPVPTPVVKTMIAATSVLITKLQNTPDMSAIMEALASVQNDLKTTAEIAHSTAARVQENTITHQQIATLSQETNQFVKATAEERRTTTALIQETNDITKEINDNTKVTNNIVKTIQSTPSSKASYASVLTSNTAPLSKPITLSTQTSSFVQAQREIIVKITDPATIESLRAKSPRNLQNHIDRAIEQSRNEHIERIRVASANQLKSGDLSIKTSSRNEAEALRQFANDWMSRIGRGASIRLPTYGVLAHGIRTSSMDMEKFEEIRAELLHDNRPFIPNADIKYIGWLSRSALTKAASTIIIEFTHPEDANKIIDEVRKTELSKVKAAYDTRQPYHFVPSTKENHLGSNTGGIGSNDQRKPKGQAEHQLYRTFTDTITTTKQTERQEQVSYQRQGSQKNLYGSDGRREWRYNYVREQPETAKTTYAVKESTRVNHNELTTQFSMEHRRLMNCHKHSLKILQYNVMRSRDEVMATLLRDPKIQEYDILALQEPWRNPFTSTTHNPISHSFHLCFPKDSKEAPARVCFFVNKRLDPSSWKTTEHTRDLTTLDITLQTSITYDDKNAQSCIDLCYGTQDLVDRVIVCKIDPSMDHNSDHLPITTTLDLRGIPRPEMNTRDWSRMDEKEFRTYLTRELPKTRCPKTKTAVDRYVGEIVAVIQAAINHSTPLKRWSPRARAGWSAECKEIQLEARRLKRQNSREHTEESWEAYRIVRNRKGRIIRRALLQGHREQVERAMQSPENMWKLAKWARNREGNVTTKISKSIGALTSLAGSTWGASVTELRRIYQAVVIPQMMYGCSVWSVAQERGEGYTKQTATSLKRLQAKAARIIGGAYKATSGAALDIELHLLPIEQQIWKINAETVSRILSTEKIPTLAEFRTLRNTRNRGRQTLYVSPLEHIYRRLYQRRGATIEEQEPIPPYIVPPWWQGPNIRIASSSEMAQNQHKEFLKHSSNCIFIYTDGSGINNQVGAAAVAPLEDDVHGK